MDDVLAQFMSITNCSPKVAEQYLNLADGRLEPAMQLFFDSGGVDLEGTDAGPAASSFPVARSSEPTGHHDAQPESSSANASRVVQIDSDEEMASDVDEDEVQITGQRRSTERREGGQQRRIPRHATPPTLPAGTEDDEAIARRMQEELFAGGSEYADGVRAPIARTRDTLMGPDWGAGDDNEDENGENNNESSIRAHIDAHIAARQRRLREGTSRRRREGPGIFTQMETTNASVWDEDNSDPTSRRRALAQATGGASETSSKASMLAEMYRPPTEIMTRLPWDQAREEGKARQKWLLVNVQDPSIFDCQLLNRDIWKDVRIRDTIKENFIFLQFNKDDDARGSQYMQFYFKDKDLMEAYPHIAIVDPRTGEQVKVWSGPPVPKAEDFLMQLHEFLDRYSLNPTAKNPIPERRQPAKTAAVDLDRMSDEQMLEMALQNSLAQQAQALDPLLKEQHHDQRQSQNTTSNGDNTIQAPPTPSPSSSLSPFARISSNQPHIEPANDPASTTRIQFRHAGGRVIRRFALTDPVRRIYEWLKAEPINPLQSPTTTTQNGDEAKSKKNGGLEFELVCSGRNLIDCLDQSIVESGLRNQTVMIEFLED